MEITIPHDLPREEVRRRLRANSHTIASAIPGGMAEVSTQWPQDDLMTMVIGLLGQSITGDVTIRDSNIRFQIALPAMFGFIEPVVEATIRNHGERMLAAPAGSSS